jgi:hypothetical protein
MSSFTEPLHVEPLENGKDWKLLAPFDYHIGYLESVQVITVPVDFITDFASIPTELISILGLFAIIIGQYYSILWLFTLGLVAEVAAGSMPRWKRYGKAAVIHDYLYYTQNLSRHMSDVIFLEAMKVLKINGLERTMMYFAVRSFGWLGILRKRTWWWFT